jgi:hypothetical protein
LVEAPERFVVFYGDGPEAFPIEVSENVEPDEGRLRGQVNVIGLDDVDQGELCGIFNK